MAVLGIRRQRLPHPPFPMNSRTSEQTSAHLPGGILLNAITCATFRDASDATTFLSNSLLRKCWTKWKDTVFVMEFGVRRASFLENLRFMPAKAKKVCWLCI